MKNYILVPIFIAFSLATYGQNVGIGTSSPNALLDVYATNNGILIPRVALTGTGSYSPLPSLPTTSTLVYNTATVSNVTPGFYYWNGSAWVQFIDNSSLTGSTTVSNTSSANTLSTTVNSVTGTGVPIINSNALSLSGNNLTATINGIGSSAQSLSGLTLAGDVTGTLGASTVAGIQGKSVAISSLASNNLLQYNGTNWVNVTPASVVGATTHTLSLTGNTLTSTVNGVAPTQSLAGLSISGDVTGTLAASTVGKIQGTGVAISSLASNNLLQYNGANWVNVTPASVLSAATTVSNTSSVNTLSTTVNSVTGAGVNIINTNLLGLSGTTLTSTINGVTSGGLNLSSLDNNIYNSDGTLTGNRTVTMGADNLTFSSTTGNFIFNPSSSGNVGIGTASTSARVTIVNADNSTNNILQVFPINLTQGVALGYNYVREIGSNGNNAMLIDAQGSGSLALQTIGTGNVGIGTSGPTAQLHTTGTVRFANYPNGLLSADANGNLLDRTLVSTAPNAVNQIDVANGNGVSGNPAINIDNAYSASVKAGFILSGGGTITYNGSAISWSNRFIVINNGTGSQFSTNGYFDITQPGSGTVITGVGSIGNVTVTGSGVPLTCWTALYYILPVGSSNGSLNANFRIVQYGSGFVAPESWILLASQNCDDGTVRVGNGTILQSGQTWTSGIGMAQNSGNGNYIWNGTAAQSANFNITGYGYAANYFQAPSLYAGAERMADGNPYVNLYSGNNSSGGIHQLRNDGNSWGYYYADGSGIGILGGNGGWAIRASGSVNAAAMDVYLQVPTLSLQGRASIWDNSDGWLRLNQQSGSGNNYPAYSNGIYSPGFFRVDGGIASGGVGSLGGGTVWATGTIRGAGYQDYSTGYQVIDAGGGWHRSYGQSGWYNGSYGGGMWMEDASYVRIYGNFPFYAGYSGGAASIYGMNPGGGIGVYGQSSAGYIGVYGYGYYGGYFYNYTSGYYSYVGFPGYKIYGVGTVSTIVKDLNDKRVALHAPETPEVYFQDFGEGRLTNGKAHIDIDPVFSKNIVVSDKHPLRAFIQLQGDCKGVYTTNETQTGFDVVELQGGHSDVKFHWTITANRTDEQLLTDGPITHYPDWRFEPAPGPAPVPKVDPGKAPAVRPEDPIQTPPVVEPTDQARRPKLMPAPAGQNKSAAPATIMPGGGDDKK
jgi:hypothetical protein